MGRRAAPLRRPQTRRRRPPAQGGAPGDPARAFAARGADTARCRAAARSPRQDDAKYASGEYAIGTDTDSYDDNDPSALNDFRAPLDPYGTWVDDPTYGTVWVPSASAVGPDFQPYVSAGHWAYDDDYVWVSDYPWGWAPFHYGRWIFIEGRGWSWIPGREYRGAWVTWSVDDGYSYLGWAPMGPAFVWFGGVAVGWHGYWGPRWAYVPARRGVRAPRRRARGRRARRRVDREPHAPVLRRRASRVGGPPPASFGYTAAQVPRATAAASVTHAQQFARPSTARTDGRERTDAVRGRPGAGKRRPDRRSVHGRAGRPSGRVECPALGGRGEPNVGRVQAAPAVRPPPGAGAYRPSHERSGARRRARRGRPHR